MHNYKTSLKPVNVRIFVNFKIVWPQRFILFFNIDFLAKQTHNQKVTLKTVKKLPLPLFKATIKTSLLLLPALVEYRMGLSRRPWQTAADRHHHLSQTG